MKKPQTLSIVGNGRMAYAIAAGLKDSWNLEIIGRNQEKLEKFRDSLKCDCELKLLQDGIDLTQKTLILCVKPYALAELEQFELSGEAHALLSVLAGISIKALKLAIPATHTIRTMPNVCAVYGRSTTALTGDAEAKDLAIEIFQSIGQAIWVESEKQLDIATALAGSGPAYLAVVAESLVDAAVREGLSRLEAEQFARGLFAGFGELYQHQGATEIKESVMSPGGTTAQAIAALEEHGARHAFFEAIRCAHEKAKKIV